MLKASWDEGMTLSSIAWFVINKPDLESRDLNFAMKAADRANRLTDGKDPSILDTLARIHYEKGDVKKAVKWQRKALAAGAGTPWVARIQQTLENYESETGK